MTIWLDQPNEAGLSGAASYLKLVLGVSQYAAVMSDLRRSLPTDPFFARDILRASGLPLLPISDRLVDLETVDILHPLPLSPVLLVCVLGRPLVIADGYYRVCALSARDTHTVIRARLATVL